jgi:hypothetical protein
MLLGMATAMPAIAQGVPGPTPGNPPELKQGVTLPRILVDRAFGNLNRDPLERLGFGRHVRLPGEPKAAEPSAPTLDHGVSRLDTDGDGLASRNEYAQGNDRRPAIGAGPTLQRGYRQRLNSQFSYADQNGDGKVSPQELQSVRGARL